MSRTVWSIFFKKRNWILTNKKKQTIFVFPEELAEICQEYYDRMYVCEGQKWDLEHEVRKRDWEVLQLSNQPFFKFKNPIQIQLQTVSNYKYTHTQICFPVFNLSVFCSICSKFSYTTSKHTQAHHHIHLINMSNKTIYNQNQNKKTPKLDILSCYFEFVFVSVSTVSFTCVR